MRHLELHILQSVPVSCLNRDDFGSPKTAIFGNVQRARVSSQCWKRAVREMLKEEAPELFSGQRTRYIINPLRKIFKEQYQLNDKDTEEKIKAICAELKNNIDKNEERVAALLFCTQSDLEYLAAEQMKNSKNKTKNVLQMKDAADIALFGRMVASNDTFTLEGAAMFSHALSTHKVSNEIDYFTAVDDNQPEEESGAGMAGTLEFNSATYYRFAALNLDMLADERHLAVLSLAERQQVVRMFIESTIKAIPSARQHSMNAMTMPSYVLVVVREKGHPVQLVNAFESPVRKDGGLVQASIERLTQEYAHLKEK